MTDVLAEIVAAKRQHVAARRRGLGLAALMAELPEEPPRGFAQALRTSREAGRHALIAEIKKASPSKGVIRPDFDPAALAVAYQAGGASCLSVLTDTPYFQGADAHLGRARRSADLPVLRKDFLVDPWQVVESRWLGADCILVIMACTSDELATELAKTALELGMDVLVEVHDEAEIKRAARLPLACLLGINNRDLKSLAVDMGTFERLAALVQGDRLLVAESGLFDHEDLARMRDAGAAAYLVGESLMRQPDVALATMRLLGAA